jgi:hypothetical protein
VDILSALNARLRLARGSVTDVHVWSVCVQIISSRTIINFVLHNIILPYYLSITSLSFSYRFKHSIDELVLPNAQLFVQIPLPLPLLRSLEKQKIPELGG